MAERRLSESDLDPDPLRQFQRWLDEAWQSGEPMANAMALATTALDGSPTARMVLLTRADERGFAFETNLESPKAAHFEALPRAALLFFWPILLRQVRITGQVSRVPAEEVRASFQTMPAEVQAMIRACRQSQTIADRATLEQRWAVALAEAPEGGAEMPPDWGGFRVSMESIEFWQGREHRLQDRLRITRDADGGWQLERLVP
ncbi:MAG TPA: pyridoxamine 5'-phosphate oxidase [Chloroflexota bacterium]|jgi:pyridoxamine 5'-phosphate oxidase|nr:pyridoxamine 5'-phosphate oxidase [Chloroflexota bacterium]